MLRTRWLANPLTGLAPLCPFKSIQIFKKKTRKLRKRYRKRCRKKIPPSIWARWGKFGFLSFFQNYTSPVGGQPKKSISRFPTDTRGWPMPNLVGILLVVWAPNPNKQTDSDRQASFIYIYI